MKYLITNKSIAWYWYLSSLTFLLTGQGCTQEARQSAKEQTNPPPF